MPATKKTGNQLAMQPNHKFSLTASYTLPIQVKTRDLGSLTFLSTYSYTGERHPYIANLSEQAMRAYNRIDARIMGESAEGPWSASLWVQNLRDEIGLVEFVPFSSEITAERGTADGWARGTMTDGRRIGFWLRWKI